MAKKVAEKKSKKSAKPAKKVAKATSDSIEVVLPTLPVLVAKETAPAGEATVTKKKKAAAPKAVKPQKDPEVPAPKKKVKQVEPVIAQDDIALRAYFIAERRQKLGWPGDATSDWVEAERQLIAEAKRAARL